MSDERTDYYAQLCAQYSRYINKLESDVRDLTARLESAENRWRLAMRRLHCKYGDTLAVHAADANELVSRLRPHPFKYLEAGDPRYCAFCGESSGATIHAVTTTSP